MDATDGTALAAPGIPAGGTAEVWWAQRQDAMPGLVGLLDQAERGRWTGFRHDADRERFLVGCALAKTLIAARTGQRPVQVSFDRACRECGRPHGKPVVAGGPQFSVAHSGDLVAVAVATAPVGIDVEQLAGRTREPGGGDLTALTQMVFDSDEQAALEAVSPESRARAFLVAWTRKEAVTKARGDGLRAPFCRVVVAADLGPPRVTAWPYAEDPRSVSLFDLDAGPRYVAALAVIGSCHMAPAGDGSALLSGR